MSLGSLVVRSSQAVIAEHDRYSRPKTAGVGGGEGREEGNRAEGTKNNMLCYAEFMSKRIEAPRKMVTILAKVYTAKSL